MRNEAHIKERKRYSKQRVKGEKQSMVRSMVTAGGRGQQGRRRPNQFAVSNMPNDNGQTDRRTDGQTGTTSITDGPVHLYSWRELVSKYYIPSEPFRYNVLNAGTTRSSHFRQPQSHRTQQRTRHSSSVPTPYLLTMHCTELIRYRHHRPPRNAAEI